MANKQYIANDGSSLRIDGAAGAAYAWSMEGVTNSNGRISAQIDLGVVSRAFIISWSCEVQFQATPTEGEGLELYYATAPDADNTQISGDAGVADAAMSIRQEHNMRGFGFIVSENATANEKCVGSGSFKVFERYLSIAGVNNSGAAIHATDTNFRFDLQVKALELQ